MERCQAVARVQKPAARANHGQVHSTWASSVGHPLWDLQRSIFSHAVQCLIQSPYIQTKPKSAHWEICSGSKLNQPRPHHGPIAKIDPNATFGTALFAVDQRGPLIAVSCETGTVEWKWGEERQRAASVAPVLSDARLYALALDGTLQCFAQTSNQVPSKKGHSRTNGAATSH
jgi:hypothetical protein